MDRYTWLVDAPKTQLLDAKGNKVSFHFCCICGKKHKSKYGYKLDWFMPTDAAQSYISTSLGGKTFCVGCARKIGRFFVNAILSIDERISLERGAAKQYGSFDLSESAFDNRES